MKKIYVLLVPLVFFLSFSFVSAANINVDDASGTDTDNGLCSLTEAILNANMNNQAGSIDCSAGSGIDTINLNTNITLTTPYLNGFNDTAGTPFITDSLIIEGNGHAITRNSFSDFRFFHVTTQPIDLSIRNLHMGNGSSMAGGFIYAVAMNNLSIVNCTFTDGASSWEGGAIYANGLDTFRIHRSIFAGNSGGIGTAVFSNDAILTITNSKFINNEEVMSNYGAALAVSYGPTTITDSTFDGNIGGAIYTSGGKGETANAPMIIRSSTFSNNETNVGGAAVRAESTIDLDILNSTFSGNQSEGASVISNYDTLSHYNINFSTFLGNSSSSSSGVINFGQYFTPATVRVMNNIFSQNVGGDCVYTTSDMDIFNNLSDDGSCGGTVATGVDQNLQNNGGQTKTHKLLAGSNAIDTAVLNYQGEVFKCPLKDQRGIVRPIDGNADGVYRCDIGAFEYKPKLVTSVSAVKSLK